MEDRKATERRFHNALRDVGLIEGDPGAEKRLKKRTVYSITRGSRAFVDNWLAEQCPGKRVLDYCCGTSGMALYLAKCGASHVIGVDISDVSVANTQALARRADVGGRVAVSVMDSEQTGLADSAFDIVYEKGALHHLDVAKAFEEMARLLKPGGRAICVEALGHNPFIQAYRRWTPQYRTPWETEHILRKADIDLARRHFGSVRVLGFFHLATIGALPFRRLPVFPAVLWVAEAIDSVLLKVPGLRWFAWQAVIELSQPVKR